MYIRKEYQLQTIAQKTFIFLFRKGEVDMTRIISFNHTAAWLWTQLYGKEFTFDEALGLLNNHYEGEAEDMKQNLQWWLDSLIKEDVIVR